MTGHVVSLWVAVMVPATVQPGLYTGAATVHIRGQPSTAVPQTTIKLAVGGPVLADGGDGQQ